MTDKKKDPPIDLGLYGRNEPSSRVGAADVIAAVLSVLWMIGVGLVFVVMRDAGAPPLDTLFLVMTLLAIVLPVAMIWVAALAAKSSRIMREESERLTAAIDGIRQSHVQAQQAGSALKPSVEKKLEEIAAAQRKTEDAIVTFTSVRHPEPQRAPDTVAIPAAEASGPEAQGRLALGTPADVKSDPVTVEDFIRALNFPETAEDKEGFRALRRALRDRQTAQVVQASQDVLTLLSQDGVYMDDFTPDRARPEVWRRFAHGERGRTIAALGGVRDRSALALASGRMRSDTIFRDSVHHFLRKFDQTFSRFEETATDQDIAELADTRTARAFMLLGRVTGIFD